MRDDPIHILLIEDDPAHAELIQRAFEDRGSHTKLTVTHTLTEAREYLKNGQPALILADWRLPDGDSSTLLAEEHHLRPDIGTVDFQRIGRSEFCSGRVVVYVLRAGKALPYLVYVLVDQLPHSLHYLLKIDFDVSFNT